MSPTRRPDWTSDITTFTHHGPGGDQALAAAHPGLVNALRALPAGGEPRTFAGVPVTRQADGRWRAAHDVNLESPRVVVHAIQSTTRY